MAGRESAEYQLWWESHCNGNSRSKQTINQQWESCPKQQNRFQTDLSSTFWNLRRHRLKLFVAISCVRQNSGCGRESRSDCPGVGYPVFYSCVAQLKSWTWRPYSTNPTKKLSNGNLEKVWWDTVNTPCCTNSRLPYEKDVTIRSAEVYMRMIQVSEAARPQFLSFRPWISGLFQQYWRNGFAV